MTTQSERTLTARAATEVPIAALGWSAGIFLVISYGLCVLFDLLVPSMAMNRVWAPLLPGFTWISWPSFFLGLVEVFAYGWYFALVFGWLFNRFAAGSA